MGLATNPGQFIQCNQIWLPHFAVVIVGGLSGLVFTTIVMLASYITTYFMAAFEEPSSYYSYSFFYISPIQVFQDLVTAAFRVLRDGDVAGIFDDTAFTSPTRTGDSTPPSSKQTPGLIMWFIRRFVLGLPLVGAGSLVHLLLSVQMLAPVQWLARYRGQRNRRNDSSRDIAALIVIGLLVVGAARYLVDTAQLAVHLTTIFRRALIKVYQLTQRWTQYLLIRAEDAILEVN